MALKGHTKIELTNIHTGEKEVYEDDNMMTNVFQSQLAWLSQFISVSTINDRLTPFSTNAMGGLLLFQEALEENANNYAMPDARNPVVGYASTDAYTDTDTKRGSKNLVESEAITNGYRYVWDFLSSQANGVISSLALTSAECGAQAYSVHDNMGWLTWSYSDTYNDYFYTAPGNILDFDFDTGVFTHIIQTSTNGIQFCKVRLPFNRLGYKSELMRPELISSKIFQIEDLNINTSALWVKGDDGYYYAFYANNSTTVTTARVSQDDWTLDTSYTSTITLQKAASINRQYASVIVKDGYIYIGTRRYFHWLPINGSDAAEYLYFSGLSYGNAYTGTPIAVQNGNIYSIYYQVLSYDDDEYRTITTRNNSTIQWDAWGNYGDTYFLRLLDNGCYFSVSYYSGRYIRIGTTREYLATINNLASPISKTSAQSMKITYTVTEADEEE